MFSSINGEYYILYFIVGWTGVNWNGNDIGSNTIFFLLNSIIFGVIFRCTRKCKSFFIRTNLHIKRIWIASAEFLRWWVCEKWMLMYEKKEYHNFCTSALLQNQLISVMFIQLDIYGEISTMVDLFVLNRKLNCIHCNIFIFGNKNEAETFTMKFVWVSSIFLMFALVSQVREEAYIFRKRLGWL